jgi:hypothetical protein
MNKYFLLSILFVFIYRHSYAQYSINSKLMEYPILIELDNGGSGTGFLIRDSTCVYLVTARHVIIGEEQLPNGSKKFGFFSNFGKIKAYPRDYEVSEPNIINIDFNYLYSNKKLTFSEGHDVLVAKIADVDSIVVKYVDGISKTGVSTNINCFSIKELDSLKNVRAGNDVYIFGYPKSLALKELEQYDFNRPLLRKGTIAARDIRKQKVIIDCPSYPGNSGGPALMVDFEGNCKVIGIVVAFIPLIEQWQNSVYKEIRNVNVTNSGYSVVEPMDEIFKLIKQLLVNK